MAEAAARRGPFLEPGPAILPNSLHRPSAPPADEGRYLVLLRKESDGQWRMSRDIGSSSLPMPLPMAVPIVNPVSPVKPVKPVKKDGKQD